MGQVRKMAFWADRISDCFDPPTVVVKTRFLSDAMPFYLLFSQVRDEYCRDAENLLVHGCAGAYYGRDRGAVACR